MGGRREEEGAIEKEEVHVLSTVGSQNRLVAREMRGGIHHCRERMGALDSGERGTPRGGF